MSKKKIGLIFLLIIIIAVIAVILANSTSKKETDETTANTSLVGNSKNADNTSKEVTVSTLSDGTLYTTTTEETKADIVVGDNFFDTQIADINLNFSAYEGKTIEIEGMYFENVPYTFVGRYSTSNLCPDCPTGYSYFEYQFETDDVELPKLKDEDDWIKVVGTLRSAYDSAIASDYYYIDVISLQVMNEKGLETVSN